MSRGRHKNEPIQSADNTFTRTFKGEDCDTIWFYDKTKTTSGPVRVDVKWHKTQKQMNAEVDALKEAKKQERRQNKFFKLKEEQNVSRSSSNSSRGRRKKSS